MGRLCRAKRVERRDEEGAGRAPGPAAAAAPARTRGPACGWSVAAGVTRDTRGNDDGVSGTDFLDEATAELYGSDPEEFTERRTALAARARAAGDRAAAKDIAGLRKPTRSAWMINQLVRADPGVADQLAGLGDELRAAAAELDGPKIRELSHARRQLVDTLIRQVLHQAGEQSPPAGLREDLTATFGAALADPQVARDLAAGTLLRAVHRADFSSGVPGLTLVPPADATRSAAPRRRAPAAEPPKAEPPGAGRETKSAEVVAPEKVKAARAAREARAAEVARAARAAEQARAAEDRRRAITEAEQAVAEASEAADRAAQAEQDERDNVRALEAQLDEAHLRVTEARRRLRETQSALQRARRALGRLGPAPRGRS